MKCRRALEMRRRARWTATALGSALAGLMLPLGTRADSFSNAYYDSRTDQLVVSMVYSGTNSNHTFTLRWGQCQAVNGGGLQEVAADVLDSQWQDAALRPYEKTVRFNLAGVPCRPAKVTLRTAPRFIYSVLIPAVPALSPPRSTPRSSQTLQRDAPLSGTEPYDETRR